MANKTTDYVPFFEAQKVADKLINSKKGNEQKIGLYIYTQIYTGLRYSDVINLTYEQLDNEFLPNFKEIKTGKKKKVKVNKNLRTILKTHFPLPENSIARKNKLFLSNKNTVFGSPYLSQVLKKHFKHLSDTEISTHSLRKSFGREVFDKSGQNEYALALLCEVFNHSNIAVTKRYLGIRQDEINNVYDSLI